MSNIVKYLCHTCTDVRFLVLYFLGIKMQIHIRGQNNHVLDVEASETVAEIKVSVSGLFIGRDKVVLAYC